MTRPRSAAVALLALTAPVPLPAQETSPSPKTRTYYIGADEVEWDYVPGGRDMIAGEVLADSFRFAVADPVPARTTYKKALYREYTDETFTTLKPRPPEWEHLGFLGPLMRGVVGDTIVVVFRNNASHPHSIHPHGLLYGKASEGAVYSDGTEGADRADDAVPPGGTHTYVWPVPERTGPGPREGSSTAWAYHSDTHGFRDVNAGLLGVILVTRREAARPDGSPTDVDREIVSVYAEVQEHQSWYSDENLGAIFAMGESAGPPFGRQFTVNGFVRGSMPKEALTLQRGERARWYVMGSLNDFDFHTPHWHGNVVTTRAMSTDVVRVGPMTKLTADMVPDNAGTWLFHCHVSIHNDAGMGVFYTVM